VRREGERAKNDVTVGNQRKGNIRLATRTHTHTHTVGIFTIKGLMMMNLESLSVYSVGGNGLECRIHVRMRERRRVRMGSGAP